MPALSILILSEDSSPSAHHTLTKLASRMLRLVERHSQTQRIHFEPAEQATKLGVRANLWKSWRAPNPRDQRAIRMLRRKLATKVLEQGVPGYVLFHFDGDRSWAKRATSENVEKFEVFVQGLRPLIEEHLQDQDQDQDQVDERLRRICPVVPFYSIESWLYQNTKLASQLCQKSCGKHLDLIDRWDQTQERTLHRQPPQSRPRRELHLRSSRGALRSREVVPPHGAAAPDLPRSPSGSSQNLHSRA